MNRKKILIGAAAVAIVAGITYYTLKSEKAAEVTYREQKVQTGEINISILSTGTVQPENRLEIKPPIAGRVERVLVKEGAQVRKGQILAWLSSTERAALLDAARSSGLEEVKRWEELYRPTPLIAPISGTVILRSVEAGQTFTASDAVLVMSDRLTIKAQVDETDIAKIKLKQPAVIVLDAYASDPIPGRVDQIAYEAKTVNNVTTYLVDVLPDTTPDFMRSGMTANVTFNLESRKDIIVIPTEGIKYSDGQSTVMVQGQKGRPTEQKIETGISDGKNTEVASGLLAGDTILIPALNLNKKDRAANPFSPTGPRGQGARKNK